MSQELRTDIILEIIRKMKEELIANGQVAPQNEMEFTILMTALRCAELEMEDSKKDMNK